MTRPVELTYPFSGRWLVQNSPANRVPSHGTHLFATTYAIDFVPVDARGHSAPLRPGSLVRPEPPETFVGFDRPVLAPMAGVVVAVHDGEGDHDAYRGLPSVGYALTQRRRVAAGWRALAGNHVVIECAPGVLVALAHLRRGSLVVRPGQTVDFGEPLGGCGNSGNSTEPHVHVQVVGVATGAHPGRLDIEHATALPLTFPGGLPRNGTIVDALAPTPGHAQADRTE